MDIRDAALVFLAESADQPVVAELARSVYDRLLDGAAVDYLLLDELLGEASGKGVLRAMHKKYDPVAFEAILAPIMHEIDATKPVRATRPERSPVPGEDPLGARPS